MKKTVRLMVAMAVATALAPIRSDASPGDEIQEIGGVKYVCRDGMCYPLENASAEKAPAASARTAQGYMDEDEFIRFLQGASAPRLPLSAGWAALFLFALLSGLAMNLTPCVLPMIPVNLMIIGSSASRGCWYALGMTLAYGALGLAAAMGLAAFGTIQANPWFNLTVAVVFAALAAALAGFWTFDLAGGRAAVTGRIEKRSGFIFPLAAGALSAALSGACVAPVLVAFLVLTADLYAKGSSAALALPFAIGLGMALPWPFAAAGLKVLPRPGGWMKWVNRTFAALLAIMAAWYIRLALIGFGVTASGAAATAASVTPENFAETLANSKRPVIVDCWASWCKNCAAMDRVIDSRNVQSALEGFTLIKLQAEDIKELQRLKGFESIKGLPAFVIFE